MQSIKRKRAGDNFTILSNEFLRDENLSLKAKGLLSYILSLPDDWKIYFEEISNHHTDSAKAARLAWKELEEHGYAKTTRIVDPENKQVKQWKKEVSDFKNPDYQKPHVANPDVGNPQCGKGQLLKTNTPNTNQPNINPTKNNMSDKSDKIIPYSEILKYLNEKTSRNFRNVDAHRKFIKARWNEGYKLEDFKIVIDNMVTNWSGKVFNGVPAENYLQPKTLFSNKFDSYLNQKPMKEAHERSLYEDEERPF
ncbi:conserved phage C-terminal domain-containing protein [Lactococcus formosensis subsp. bovis]|uniref:conserved phage C-terminal domain-containing protein n=1 Tax=Lactococcus formosensis TaxID=1281486 RepID=UPI0020BD8D76|nr:conserved phage C-terminal domain-containing protein [Lactococcus formosensis]